MLSENALIWAATLFYSTMSVLWMLHSTQWFPFIQYLHTCFLARFGLASFGHLWRCGNPLALSLHSLRWLGCKVSPLRGLVGFWCKVPPLSFHFHLLILHLNKVVLHVAQSKPTKGDSKCYNGNNGKRFPGLFLGLGVLGCTCCICIVRSIR